MIWWCLGLFLAGFLPLVHAYIVFPLTMKWLARKPSTVTLYQNQEQLPEITVLMAVYNEAKVISQKMDSLLELSYPPEKLRFYIGSDASTDATNDLLQYYAEKDDRITFFPFVKRRGKPELVNELVRRCTLAYPPHQHHCYLMTDANVLLKSDCLFHLAKHFKDPAIGLVDAHMIHTGMELNDISTSEFTYINREVRLKHWESRAGKYMLGPFGGCYLLRSDLYVPVPNNFLVDDFYLAMQVFKQGASAINELAARCQEPVSHEMSEEFRRKVRISSGNFQNLVAFRSLWWPPTHRLGYIFFSHKILRWFGPFFLMMMLLGAIGIFLGTAQTIRYLFLFVILGMVLLPALDFFFEKLGIHFRMLRHIRYFMAMNIALFVGFIKFTHGIRSSIWQPTKRI